MFKNNHNRPRPRPHWRTAALGTVLGASVFAAGLFTLALALDPVDPFEVDGNVQDDAAAGIDWASALPLTDAGETFIPDQVPPLGSETYYTGGGSKDDNDVPGWKTTVGNPTPNKNNITNAYAKAMTDPATGHLIIYFGADRFADEGDAAMGFWFFKNDVAPSGNGFSGVHTDQDILVQVDYVNGGSTAEVQIFKWQSDGTGTHGSPKKVLKEIGFGSGAGNSVVCNTSGPAPNSACVTTNNVAIPALWTFDSTDGGTEPDATIPARQFIEGAIDITALIGPVCFSSFLASTRSSHSETAQLKDFALGDFELCNVSVSKACDTDSPKYIPGTDLFSTEHVVTISNDGFGSIFDVQFQDNAITDTTQCDIIKIGNTAVSIPIGDNDDWNDVVNELAGNSSIDVRLLCLSPQNSFANQVTVRASSVDGGAPMASDADDTDTEDAGNVAACHLDVEPLIDLTKDCKGLSLDPVTFKPQVCATITVKNPVDSGQYLDVSSIKNYPGTGGVSGTGTDVTSAFQAANGGSLVLQNNGTPVSFDICYEPTAADSGAVVEGGTTLDPSKVKFSDTVEVVAIGRANNTEVKDSDDAFCKLCPECPDC